MGQLPGSLLHKPEGALGLCISPHSDKPALVSPRCDSREGDLSQGFNYVISSADTACSRALSLPELGRKTDASLLALNTF